MNKPKTPANRRKKKTRSVGRPRKAGNTASNNPAEEILKVASVLFSSKGYTGTTMADIADVVGIRGPSLYYHFEAKGDILRALSNLGLGGAVKISDQVRAETSLSPAAGLFLLMQRIILHLRSSDYDFNCLFDPAFKEKQFRDINKQISSWMKTLEGFVIDAVKSDQLMIEDTELTAYTLRGLIRSSVSELAHFAHLSPDEIARHIVEFAFLAMIKNKSTLKSIRKELQVYKAAA